MQLQTERIDRVGVTVVGGEVEQTHLLRGWTVQHLTAASAIAIVIGSIFPPKIGLRLS